jgi:hypothetical protein
LPRARRTTPLAAEIIKARGLRTRREFSAVLTVTEGTLFNWETGRTEPRDVGHVFALVREGVPRGVIIRHYAPEIADWLIPLGNDKSVGFLIWPPGATVVAQWTQTLEPLISLT